MKVPLNWLREFVPIDMDAEDLSHKLTMRGLEVESLEPIRADLYFSFQRALECMILLGKFQKSEGLISGGSVTPLVISNLSKGEMLKTYFWRTARPRILPFLFSFAFLIYIIYIMGR